MPSQRDACFIQFHVVFHPWHHKKGHAHLHHVAYFWPPFPHPHNHLKLLATPFLCYKQSLRKYNMFFLQSWWGLGLLQKSNNRLFCYKTQSSRTLSERILSFLLGSVNLVSSFFQVLGICFVCWVDYELDYLALKLKCLLFRTHWKHISYYIPIDLITKRF